MRDPDHSWCENNERVADLRIAELEAENKALDCALSTRELELKEMHQHYDAVKAEVKALRELLSLIRDDLRMRSEDGVVDISDFIWMRMDKALQEQGDG